MNKKKLEQSLRFLYVKHSACLVLHFHTLMKANFQRILKIQNPKRKFRVYFAEKEGFEPPEV